MRCNLCDFFFSVVTYQVLVTMGGNESCHLHGLSFHRVTSVEEATRLYQLGLETQKTAETLDNQRSSRSHTVFSIMIFRQKYGAELFLRCVEVPPGVVCCRTFVETFL